MDPPRSRPLNATPRLLGSWDCTPPINLPPQSSHDGTHTDGVATTVDAAAAVTDVNLRGACFPGHPETNVLGCIEGLADWHGLSGHLRPTPWWEKTSWQFHHDGGFSATSPPPPAIVAMYCEKIPKMGGSTLRWPDGTSLPYEVRSVPRTHLEQNRPARSLLKKKWCILWKKTRFSVSDSDRPHPPVRLS